MKKFRVPFKKEVHGFAVVKAESKENLGKLLDPGEWIDEFDNDSIYEFDKKNIEEIKE